MLHHPHKIQNARISSTYRLMFQKNVCPLKILLQCVTRLFSSNIVTFVRYIQLTNVILLIVVTTLIKMGIYRSQNKAKRSRSRKKWARAAPQKCSDMTQINSNPLQRFQTCLKSFLSSAKCPDLVSLQTNQVSVSTNVLDNFYVIYLILVHVL